MKVSTLIQLKAQAKKLNSLIAKFPTVRSLVRKWGFELTVIEGQIEVLEAKQPETSKQLTIWDIKPMPKSPEEAVKIIQKDFFHQNSRVVAKIWQKHEKTRIYLEAIDKAPHLRKLGFISYDKNGSPDFSEVGGFGEGRELLKGLVG